MTSLDDRFRLDGRVAVVVGGAGVLGAATARGLAQLGADIAVLDLDAAASATVADDVADVGVRTTAHACDVTDDGGVRSAIDAVVDELGGIDVVVNFASLVGTSEGLPGWCTSVDEQSIDTWRRAVDVGLTGGFSVVQAALPALRASTAASIVNVASIYGLVGPDLRLYEGTDMGNPAAYAAAKGGVVQLTRWLATVLAPHVRVNVVSPGGVARSQDQAFVDRYEARTPLGRMATEADVVGAVAFLAGDLASYVTGHNLVVDGGWTAW